MACCLATASPVVGAVTGALPFADNAFDAAGDWYGGRVRVEFVARLRDTMKFAGPEALVQQLHSDAEHARSALTALVPAAKLTGSGTNTSSLP